eukprot:CAMPEP_0182544744 /NCGR_PEP_ID=MMETSP1323-20130603/33576_1 /TAXON_ID=236787 /ORGANISM="Florenciella parvula, Strain RCC1693" /LENGTH=150 /DNA_ID=CAMNT_0024755825 /DNA_START=493 /DNA_END=945 /DNA_ORIENTATION=+
MHEALNLRPKVLPHPSLGLRVAPALQHPAQPQALVALQYALPQLLEPTVRQGRHECDRRLPTLHLSPLELHCESVLGGGAGCGRDEITVVLVHYKEVGDLNDPLLDPLQLITTRRWYHEGHHINRLVNQNLTLAQPHRLHNDRTIPRALA